jgi:hypothetical protein
MGKVETIWAWVTLMNGLQVFPNLVGLIGLSGVAASMLRQSRVKPATPSRLPWCEVHDCELPHRVFRHLRLRG